MPLSGTTGTDSTQRQEAVGIGVLEVGQASTATAVAGAATLNQGGGIVTSESITTAAGGFYTLTLTNALIDANTIVFVESWLGTSTTGVASAANSTPGAGSAVILIENVHASAAFNGTIKIGFFLVRKASTPSTF